ncbi:putative bifunctional diguanylate cyclase/phosphodiesterase [Sphingomonas qilianensis]|uniref:putative bifunctional diguanylate cyclase/phosphodiesterase n=1 Tax=Sphingomonas qilianensis TaxID=1736690 RepID=UPI0036096D38
MHALIDVMSNPVVVKTRSHRMVLANRAACTFFGRSREALLGQIPAQFRTEQAQEHEAEAAVFASGKVDEREEQVTDAGGTTRHIATRKQLVNLSGTQYLVVIMSDLTAHREAEAQMRNLATHDQLTGLPNATLMHDNIAQSFPHRSGSGALLVIDLDHFGLVNDNFGFYVGNEVLIQFGRRLTDIVRNDGTVARLGGDAFAILLTTIGMGLTSEEICRRVLAAASQIFHLSDARAVIGASIGVVVADHHPVEPTEMMRRAGVALQKAKDEGRGQWQLYSDELDRQSKHRHSTETDLRRALSKGGELEIHYQPLTAVTSGNVVAFEALVRWNHPERGMVMPDEFIAVAEASGLIVALGELVLARACQDAMLWTRPLRLSINVSPVQFVRGDLVGAIQTALSESGLDPHRLEIEITEGVLINNPTSALDQLSRIQSLGVHIVLDDFGSGFSSLAYLRYFPFDKVKIDKTFIADMIDNGESAAIVESILLLAKNLKITVVAEGVENVDQLDLLRSLGCDQAQGYLISRPMPIANFEKTVFGADI